MTAINNHKLLLNRHTVKLLHQSGQSELGQGLTDIHAARRFALWSNHSGAETYLFALVTAAARQTARHYLAGLNLQPGLKRFAIAGASYTIPFLAEMYRAFPEIYPNDEFRLAGLAGQAPGQLASRQKLLAEAFLLDSLIENPAAQVFRALFDDAELCRKLDYRVVVKQLDACFVSRPGGVIAQGSLAKLLRAPGRETSGGLPEQAAYIVAHWEAWLPERLLAELRLSQAIAAEENQPRLHGPGPSPLPLFGHDDGSNAPPAFTADIDWMSSAVLLAKSIYVWLDQLSSAYQRKITTLAAIPDEELARLADRGFNALWLIGLWERSAASRKIKQLCGNPEAEASAYALQAYRVAAELGGEEALANLEQRCQQHGIRLACDVVPNHTGIDSEWVLEHPDWFLQTELPPYPAYRFSGPDLCEAEGVSIRIEDGYWDHSDAAVVCEHHDHQSGRRRYIYHGNDGTHMPWNDTAQLNFLLPEVRRAMSDLIVAVAKRFRLIRFDAAMTLARKHFRRLWFPAPGGSAGVPSRSVFWMSDEDFNAAFPEEFWREVVDRINREAPDTLLIAEAFWLMESYFVRNLGMHRVYNSAFMNMLKREENAKYRKILKDILAYNPEILKRYVNFMNNPDEATAVEQFDKGNKYFGVATLLATLPGLPMFGHGQIEGYREKYGMEYRRAYWQEAPDSGFIEHHERQIFPLLKRRKDFAGVENFSLYDFSTSGGIDENVYAFSNGPTSRRVLVVYNNAAQRTTGRLNYANPKATAEFEGVAHAMPALWQALGIDPGPGRFCRFRNLVGAEYLLPAELLREGLELHLEAYEHQVFSNFLLLDDPEGSWQALYNRLRGQAVDNLDRERLKLAHGDLWKMFAELFNLERLKVLSGGVSALPQTTPVEKLLAETCRELDHLAVELCVRGKLAPTASGKGAPPWLPEGLSHWLSSLSKAGIPKPLLAEMWHGHRASGGLGTALLGWLLLEALGERLGLRSPQHGLELINRFGLDFAWQAEATSRQQQAEVFLALQLMRTVTLTPHPAVDDAAFAALCNAPQMAGLLGVNKHAGVTWFSEEGFTALAGTLALQAAIIALAEDSSTRSTAQIAEALRQRLARAAAVGYRLDKFLQLG